MAVAAEQKFVFAPAAAPSPKRAAPEALDRAEVCVFLGGEKTKELFFYFEKKRKKKRGKKKTKGKRGFNNALFPFFFRAGKTAND